jgi:hypothetical protein
MAHEITRRALLPEEAAVLRDSIRMTADNWTWVAMPVIASGFFAFLVGKLLAYVLEWNHLPPILALSGVGLGIIPSVWLYRMFALERTEVISDLTGGSVEVVDVCDPVLVSQEEYNSEGPICYLDIGRNKILFLWGQGMYDPHVFPGSAGHSDPAQPDQCPFPCSRFRLHRIPESGRVLRVELQGNPVAPNKMLKWRDIPLSGLRPSEILDGTLDELRDLKKAVRQAKAGGLHRR